MRRFNSITLTLKEMKKILYVAMTFALVFAFNACENSDCECKYYDENSRIIASESWDGDDISSCQNLENDSTVEINDQVLAVSSISCSESW